MVSVVSDIRKSSYFGGYNDRGDAELLYPISQVHLVMDKSLSVGRVYQVPIPTQQYEDYHLAVDDEEELGLDGGACGCDCPHCAACRGNHAAKLPANFYVLSVPDDLYRRVLDEICDSKQMPCGMFFCGHHEDVSRPSIWIPVTIIILLFGGMGAAAFLLSS